MIRLQNVYNKGYILKPRINSRHFSRAIITDFFALFCKENETWN